MGSATASPTISEIARIHLRWALTDGVGPLTFQRLCDHFGDAERALGVSAGQLQDIKGIGRERANRIASSREMIDVETEIAAAGELGIRILCREDADYPAPLKQIPDPPIVLFVRGELRATDAIAIAVVGSRKCTINGGEQARRFGELLAGAGLTVVSGLARGVDSFAHHGAIAAGGRTLAVMGNGLNRVYPPENQALAEQILQHGAWISELPVQAAVRAENFPSRNRIIAGLSLGTLVVEAAHRSGALITARLANDYNREVFALPGRATDPMSRGTNELIRDGIAKLVLSLDDILDGLGAVGEKLRSGAAAATKAEATGAALPLFDGPAVATQTSASHTPLEGRVLAALVEETTVDELIRTVGTGAGEVIGTLTALELKGLIKRLPGQRVAKRA